MNKYILAIPFYKNENFIEEIIIWYKAKESYLDKLLISEVVIYNDCPSSENSVYLEKKCLEVGFSYISNLENIGYLKTVNLAYNLARIKSCNLILLNSDTIPFSGFLEEINNCFLTDSMLGVVSVRSNNATICNLYNEPDYYGGEDSLVKYKTDSKKLSKYLPHISYVPVVTGFCFAIHEKLIENFDGFDEIFTVGYEEENEYCLRISERGFRIGIANKAFVVHMEGKSFGLTKTRDQIKDGNALIIRYKYPYYDTLIDNYSVSVDKRAQSLVSQSIANKVKYLIDARVLSACHNGSNKFIIEFLKAFSNLELMVDVIADADAVSYHCIDKLENVNFIKNPVTVYEYGFMLGQPMHHSTLWLMPMHSLVSTCIFFDTIAHDCPQLRSQNISLDSIWALMPYIYTDISFISEHSRVQFELKFGAGTSNLHTHLLPIMYEDKAEYASDKNHTALIFGNKFLHKGQDILLKNLSGQHATTYYVLGPVVDNVGSNIKFLAPGETDGEQLDRIMRSVDYILMPSFAEGFGFPLLEAVSYGKKIYCRDIDCYREIISALPVEKAKLIRLVTSFDFPLNYLDNGDSNIYVKSYTSYEEYALQILSHVEKKNSIIFFGNLKARLHMISSMSLVSAGESSIGLLRSVYKFFLRTRFRKIFKAIKFLIFKFTFFKKLLG
jgi:GT2 family glycosyltransferase